MFITAASAAAIRVAHESAKIIYIQGATAVHGRGGIRLRRSGALAVCLTLLIWADDAGPTPRDRELRVLERIVRSTGNLSLAGALSIGRSSGTAKAPPRDALKLERLARTAHDPHVRGVAQLLTGRTDAATTTLSGAAASTRNADTWSDLSAAYLASSDIHGTAESAVDALAAADVALSLQADHAAAPRNRALALRRLGLTESWGTAKSGASRLPSPRETWMARLAEFRQAVEANDLSSAHALIDGYSEHARAWGESVFLSEWADRPEELERSIPLKCAVVIGRRLCATKQECLLDTAASVVVRAVRAREQEKLAALASAYRVYLTARLAHRDGYNDRAEALFVEAGALFRRAGTPMALVARYYLAASLFAQYRLREAREVLAELGTAVDASAYPALAAAIGWERGLCETTLGSVAEGAKTLRRSATAFTRLGEHDNAASLEALLADAVDVSGDHREAWELRARAFRHLHAAGLHRRVAVGLGAAATYRMHHSEWTRAASLLAEAYSIASAERDVPLAAYLAARQAVVFSRLNDASRGENAIRNASRWTAQLGDPFARARADAELALGRAAVNRRRPHAAIRSLTAGLAYYEIAAPAMSPPILLERARLRNRIGDEAGAQRDRLHAIEILEDRRAKIHSLEQRATFFVAAHALFREAIAATLRDGDVRTAFTLTERHRARTIAESLGIRTGESVATIEDVQHALADDAAIVSYLRGDDHTTALVLRRRKWSAVRLRATAATLTNDVAALASAFSAQDRDTSLKALSVLHSALIDPVLPHLDQVRTVVWVGAPPFADVSFDSLFDRRSRRFLFERFDCVHAPSAATAVHASRRAPEYVRLRVLSVGANVFGTATQTRLEPLPAVAGEASRIARLYDDVRTLVGADATTGRIVRHLAEASVFHFAGHALSARQFEDAALVAHAVGGDVGLLSARQIAAARLPQLSLAVLTSCRSATVHNAADGPESVAWAFLMAGVPTVVAAPWPVADATGAEFGLRFHRSLRETGKPVSAYRQTLRDMARDTSGGVADPAKWGRFMLIGGAPGVVRPKGMKPWSSDSHTNHPRPQQ